jgi:hypothetical protein
MTELFRKSTVIVLVTLLSIASAAQQTSTTGTPQPASSAQPSPAQASGSQTPPPPHEKTAEEILREEEHQRALGVVPMFGMTSYHNAPPLTSKQKFQLMAKATLDPFTWVAVGLQAGISQAQNSFEDYGQGAQGFGKYYGAGLADNFDSNFFSNFFYPVLLKEDPRYFRLGEGSVKHRMVYSLEQEFVAHTDKGGRSFNWSNSLGAVTAGSISNAYYPESDRGFGLTMSRSAISLLYGSAGGLFLEFWPDINRKLLHKHVNQANPPEPAGTPPK